MEKVIRKTRKKKEQVTAAKVAPTQINNDDPVIRKPRTINEVLGIGLNSKYKQTEVEDYEIALKNMGKTDLQSHAASVGISPVYEKSLLIRLLIQEYVRVNSAYYGVREVINQAQKPPSSIENILKHAR